MNFFNKISSHHQMLARPWNPLIPGDLYAWYDASATNSSLQDGAAQFTAACKHYLSVASNASLQTGNIDFEIGCWVYLDSNPATDRTLLTKSDGSTSQEYALYLAANRQPSFYVTPNGTSSGYGQIQWNIALSTATWYFIRAWHDATANKLRMSVNGAATQEVSYSTGVFVGASSLKMGTGLDGRILPKPFHLQQKRLLSIMPGLAVLMPI